ncbi:MAG: UDP-glucose/GDP-mannose dehydrogenase family protein [Phycisphaerales bacterium]|nr:UDP-glucose/GDP-mannose dehydrogenase family protein [Phycisphaerales bacterium]
MKLTMVGTGYVGLVTGTCFANTGNDVTCLDIDQSKIDMLNRGEVPIYEPGLAELITYNTQHGRLHFTSDKEQAYRDADMIFICVGTPTGADGDPDLQYVFAVADDIAAMVEKLGPDAAPKTVVVKSTVPVGTSHAVRDRIRSQTSLPFHIADNPEFLKEGAAINDFNKPDRVVCGVETEEAAERMRELYEPFVRQGNPIFIMDILSAEMVKYAANAMLATKISFINEIANLCEAYGANINRVREGMCSDRRIGNQFLHPGLGYGGSCFPKDTLACISMGKKSGQPTKLAQAVHDVNQDQRDSFWKKINEHFHGQLRGKSLAFWGLAFKPHTDDIREAPALSLISRALEAGASVRAFDPVAAENTKKELPDVRIVDDQYEALTNCDALVISTDWDEFKQPDFDRIAEVLRAKVIFDGRNLFRLEQMRDHGFTYHSVGRPPVTW